MNAPIAVEDLDRDELLALVKAQVVRPSPHDLLFARWRVLTERAHAVRQQSTALYGPVDQAFAAYRGAATASARAKGMVKYHGYRREQEHLEARARRLDRRADVVYEQMLAARWVK